MTKGHRIQQSRNEQVVQEFKRRYTRALVTFLLLVFLALYSVIRGTRGYPPSLALVIIGLALAFWAFLFTLMSWRCPSCERYLGQAFRDKFCPHCGIPLR